MVVTIYWLRVRDHGTGQIRTLTYDAMLTRALAAVLLAPYVDVLAEGMSDDGSHP